MESLNDIPVEASHRRISSYNGQNFYVIDFRKNPSVCETIASSEVPEPERTQAKSSMTASSHTDMRDAEILPTVETPQSTPARLHKIGSIQKTAVKAVMRSEPANPTVIHTSPVVGDSHGHVSRLNDSTVSVGTPKKSRNHSNPLPLLPSVGSANRLKLRKTTKTSLTLSLSDGNPSPRPNIYSYNICRWSKETP